MAHQQPLFGPSFMGVNGSEEANDFYSVELELDPERKFSFNRPIANTFLTMRKTTSSYNLNMKFCLRIEIKHIIEFA